MEFPNEFKRVLGFKTIDVPSDFKRMLNFEVVKTYICPNCHEPVEVRKMKVIGGGQKGRPIEMKYGCTCEDVQLGQETVTLVGNPKINKALNDFNAHSVINDSLRNCTFQSYEPLDDSQKNALNIGMRFTEHYELGKSGNLLFVGNTGVGKSHLACAVVHELLTKGYSALFITVPRLLTKMKATWSKNDQSGLTEADILEMISTVDLLVLDDLGAEAVNDKDTTRIFEILESRQNKTNIITTNVTSSKFKELFGVRLYSRMMHNTFVVRINGEDYRVNHSFNVGSW